MMTWVLVGVGAAAACFLAALTIGLVDELRQPPSNTRRMGVGLALVAGFAGVWLLTTPVRTVEGVQCAASAMVLAEYDTPAKLQPPDCVNQLRLNTALGLLSAAAAPVAVLTTRSRRD